MSLQKKLAAQILKVGRSRIWLDPSRTEDIRKAITKADIRRLIQKGYIKVLPAKIKRPRKKKKRRRGAGRRTGAKFAALTKKRRWTVTIRPLRRMLKELKATGQLEPATYRRLLALAKGGMFKSRAHLRIYLEQRGLLRKR